MKKVVLANKVEAQRKVRFQPGAGATTAHASAYGASALPQGYQCDWSDPTEWQGEAYQSLATATTNSVILPPEMVAAVSAMADAQNLPRARTPGRPARLQLPSPTPSINTERPLWQLSYKPSRTLWDIPEAGTPPASLRSMSPDLETQPVSPIRQSVPPQQFQTPNSDLDSRSGKCDYQLFTESLHKGNYAEKAGVTPRSSNYGGVLRSQISYLGDEKDAETPRVKARRERLQFAALFQPVLPEVLTPVSAVISATSSMSISDKEGSVDPTMTEPSGPLQGALWDALADSSSPANVTPSSLGPVQISEQLDAAKSELVARMLDMARGASNALDRQAFCPIRDELQQQLSLLSHILDLTIEERKLEGSHGEAVHTGTRDSKPANP